MKICLIMPLETHNMDLARLSIGEIMEPIGLSYLASMVHNREHEVCIIDRRVHLWLEEYNLKRLDRKTLDLVQNFEPDLIGFHMPTVMMKDTQHFASIAKEALPEAKIIVGGPHATYAPKAVLKDIPSVDIIVRGEGEMTFREVAEGRSLSSILGITYRSEDKMVSTEDRPLISDLDVLPLPARDLLNIDFYFNPNKNILVDYKRSYRGQDPRMGEILTSRGCPMQCAFCACPILWKGKARFHSEKWVLQDLIDIMSHGANFVYFNDDVFTVNPKRVLKLCRSITREGLNKQFQWVAQSRPDQINREMLSAMKKAGCMRIEFGFESGSQRILNSMKKNTTVSQYYRAVEIARETGLDFQANIIFGYPDEGEQDVLKTMKFLEETKASSVLLNAFYPVPGTEIYQELKATGFRINDDFMPSHPYLTPYNFTSMSDKKYEEVFWRLMEMAPEALTYWEQNKQTFRKVAEEVGGKFALKGGA